MKVPNRGAAIISPERNRDYLLADAHPVGRFKAQYFCSLGYRPAAWRILSTDLFRLLEQDVSEVHKTEFGCKYRVDGGPIGPGRMTGEVTTIWIILDGEQAPRFITAYPRRTA